MVRRVHVEYPARITPQEGGGYLVDFPDLDGCFTEGDSLEEARRMGREALTGWIESELARGSLIPEPESIGPDTVMISPEPHVAIPLILKNARQAAGLSQKAMAARMGIGYTTYRLLEYPKRFNATIKSLERASQALGLNLRIELVQ